MTKNSDLQTNEIFVDPFSYSTHQKKKYIYILYYIRTYSRYNIIRISPNDVNWVNTIMYLL